MPGLGVLLAAGLFGAVVSASAETAEQAAAAAMDDFNAKASGKLVASFKPSPAERLESWDVRDAVMSGVQRFGVARDLRIRVHKSCLEHPLVKDGRLSRDEMAQAVGDLFVVAVEEGLSRLNAYSPDLVDRIQREIAGRSPVLQCLRSSRWNGFYNPFLVRIAVLGLDDRASSLARWYQERRLGAVRQDGEGLRQWPDSEMRYIKSVVFHEFLHFAFIKDQSIGDQIFHHATRYDLESSRKQYDKVYSCSGLAFSGLDWVHTAQSCQTCLGSKSPDAKLCRGLPQGRPSKSR